MDSCHDDFAFLAETSRFTYANILRQSARRFGCTELPAAIGTPAHQSLFKATTAAESGASDVAPV